MSKENLSSLDENVNNFVNPWLEDVKNWIKAMGQQGLYQPTTARFRITALERISSILGPDEQLDITTFLEGIDNFGRRYAMRYNANPSTVRAYSGRAKTALEDFLQYRSDPAKFKGRGYGPRPKRSVAEETSLIKVQGVKGEVDTLPSQPLSNSIPNSAFDSLYSEIRRFPLDEQGQNLVFQLPARRITSKEFLKISLHLLSFCNDFNPALQGKFLSMMADIIDEEKHSK